jgi:hypothetical protein
MEERLKWLLLLSRASTAFPTITAETKDDHSTDATALLLDPRLLWSKSARIDSFVAGTVAMFLPHYLLPGSKILRELPEATLRQLRILLIDAIPGFVNRVSSSAAGLLYRSTRDGANANAFHYRCDDQGPTLTLIKDSYGFVFGGYTSKSWSSPLTIEKFSDPEAVMFSVVGFYDKPVAFPSNGGDSSIRCIAGYGPWFGGCVYLGLYLANTFGFGRSCAQLDNEQYSNTTGRHAYKVFTKNCGQFTPAIVEVYRL